jgi:hypothetical protein
VNNLGDFLGRENYVCGGPNPITADRYKRLSNMGSILNRCDGSGVPASSCNVKFVPDSSDYITFKKQRAMNQNYNDLSNGGDQNNASYVPLMAVSRSLPLLFSFSLSFSLIDHIIYFYNIDNINNVSTSRSYQCTH